MFKGPLLRGNAAEPFSDQVLVLRDLGIIGNNVGGWLRTDEPVHLESACFNATYTVWNSWDVDAFETMLNDLRYTEGAKRLLEKDVAHPDQAAVRPALRAHLCVS